MTDTEHWHYEKCPNCGSMLLCKDKYVSPCKSKKCANLHRAHRSNQHRYYHDTESFIVVKDPVPVDEGGFRKGTIITRIQADCMCQCGTFSDGTILQGNNNKRFQVATDLEGRQNLLPLT